MKGTIDSANEKQEQLIKKKEDKWMKKKQECEDRLELVAAAMKDFNLTIKWNQNQLVVI